ncbi:MAG: SH3 domain-containing protein [Chloroflexi bacterium]|nr:SH3 domain-containing protein [Chloroflexota bacterium]
MKARRALVAVLLLLLLMLTAGFQGFEPVGPPANPNAVITWPPPIYLLRGTVEIRGTANVQGMIGHYIEFRPLNADFTVRDDASAGWTPATLPINVPVVDNVLGTWDTTVVDDGAYEIRLAVITSTGTLTSRVSPLRIENNPPPFVQVQPPVVVATQVVFPTQPPAPLPTATPSNPQATPINVNVNVRSGDSVNYPTVGSLVTGQSADIIGQSSRGTGWWYIRLPNGRLGWVSPDVVAESGSLAGIPFIDPPPPPATATPIPPTTSPLPDGTITNVRFDRSIKQGESFQVIVTVYNNSSISMGQVSVACNFTPQNTFVSTQLGGLGPFTQTDVAITARLDTGGGGNTTANCAIDVNNLIQEINEGNNFFNLTAFLAMP